MGDHLPEVLLRQPEPVMVQGLSDVSFHVLVPIITRLTRLHADLTLESWGVDVHGLYVSFHVILIFSGMVAD